MSGEQQQKHHRYSPSSLMRRHLCPASARMEGLYPETEASPAAAKGTEIHRRIADWIGMCLSDACLPRFLEDADAQETSEAICEFVEGIVRGGVPPYSLRAEMRLQLRDPFGDVLTEGTADLVWRDAEGLWHLADWKTGRTPVPPEEENWQLAAYAAMLAQAAGADRVCAHIVQPPLLRCTETTFTASQLEEATQGIMAVIDAGEAVRPQARPSAEACRFCSARLHCMAWRLSREGDLATPHGLDPATMADDLLAEEYARATAAAAYGDALKAELEKRCAERGRVAGWTLRERQGARYVSDTRAALEAVGEWVGADEAVGLASVSLSDLARAVWQSRLAEDPAAKLKDAKADVEEAVGQAGALARRPSTRTLVQAGEG